MRAMGDAGVSHRSPRQPGISVVMAAHNAESSISRSIESVLAQRFADVQLVIVLADSQDQTATIAQRVADRDVRLDIVPVDNEDTRSMLDAGFDAATGTYVVFMRQDDWFGPGALEYLYNAAHEADLELAVPVVSFDFDSPRGERVSRFERTCAEPSQDVQGFRSQAHCYIENGVLDSLYGKLLRRDRVVDLGLRIALMRDEESYITAYLEGIARVAPVDDAVYHVAEAHRARARFDAGMFERVEHDHEALLDLAKGWGMEADEQLSCAIHRRHLFHIVSCIDSVCSRRSLSSIERCARIRDMIEAPSTRESVRVLRAMKHASRDLGVMYASIAQRNVVACCIGVRFSRLSHAIVPNVHPLRGAAAL